VAHPLCFVIGPYGEEDTETRRWSDFLVNKIIAPAVKDRYRVERTLDNRQPGVISTRVQRDLRSASVVIADLTGSNPNAYFELGFRHALGRPFIHVARADTQLPFDTRGFDVVTVPADYVAAKGYFSIDDDRLAQVHKALQSQLAQPVSVTSDPLEPISPKVYEWQMSYKRDIATMWLSQQPAGFQDEVARYEAAKDTEAISPSWFDLFAEYRALTESANVSGDGTIFVTCLNQTGKVDIGFAAFRFDTRTDPVLIKIEDLRCDRAGVASIRFMQPSRPYSFERGGRPVRVNLPRYNYTLVVEPDASQPGRFVGDLAHPHTKTPLGRAELTPRYGEYFR
jgi:hypothetical protein